MTKTKEQLEEEKKIALSIRIKPLDLDSMDTDDLKDKAKELFNIVIALETERVIFSSSFSFSFSSSFSSSS